MAKDNYFYALGRRKSATARVRLTSGKGNFTINGKSPEDYFASSKYLIKEINKPFQLLDMDGKFDASIVVSGGGHSGQVDAIRLALSKALTEVNEDLKGTLKRAGYISRDPREKERKKFGLRGARKQRQFTKR